MKTKIIYEDDALLVIYKPAGIATQTSKIGQADVVSELKNYLAGQSAGGKNAGGKFTNNPAKIGANNKAAGKKFTNRKPENELYLGVIHRLDQPVEGLLVFAKTRASAAKLSAQLGKGTLNKQYYAVIGGQPAVKEGELVDKLCKTADNRAMVVTGQQEVPAEAKDAVLQYCIVESMPLSEINHRGAGIIHDTGVACGGRSSGMDVSEKRLSEVSGERKISLADIHIDTGRFHQIRAQMAHHGMALLGDAKYADEETRKLSQQLFVRNVALCAYSLEIVHPVTGKMLSFEVKPEGRVFQYFRKEG